MSSPSGGFDGTAAAPGTTAVASATPDTVVADPAISGRYRIVETIAPGAEDALYLARRLDTGAQVELRILTGSLGGDRVLAAALVQHATLVARIAGECPGIAAFYGCERTAGGLVLAMAHPGGPTLREVIKREGTLGLDRALRLALELARVLERVHKLGLVHGGLRPENVVLTGPEERIALTHFGLDWILRWRSPDTGSRQSSPLHDPVYRAPEQTWDQTTARSDIYSLGAIVYEMLAGAPPPASAPSHPRASAEPLRNCRADISQELERIVMQALHVAPERRPADIAVVVDALTAELERDRQPKPAGDKTAASVAGGMGKKRLFAWGGVAVLAMLAIWVAHARMTSGVLLKPVPQPVPPAASAHGTAADPPLTRPAPSDAPGSVVADPVTDLTPVARDVVTPPAPMTGRTPAAVAESSTDTRDASKPRTPLPSVSAAVTQSKPAESPKMTVAPATRPRRDTATAPPASASRPQPSRETRDTGDDPGAIIDWLLSEGAGKER
jgi:serine/threonine protein kinase